MVKILAAATAWHLVTCVCALLACSARAIATAKSTTHCQHMPALCALCKSHNSNRCAPRQRAVSMCCMHRRNGCRSTRCDLETGLGRRYGALAHHLRAHWRLPAMILRMIDRVAVEQQVCPKHSMHMCTARGTCILASCRSQRDHDGKHRACKHPHRGV